MAQAVELKSGGPTEDGRRVRGAKSRAAILEHAAAIASVDGLDGLTIGRLATEAGVAKGNIQVLFGDKQALQLAVIDWVQGFYDAMIVAPALRSEGGALVQLRALIEGWFVFVEGRQLPGGCFTTAVASEFRARPGAILDRVAEIRRQKRERYVRLVDAAKAAGAVKAEVESEQVAFDLLALQSYANTVLTIGDNDYFARARRTSLARLADIATPAPKKSAQP